MAAMEAANRYHVDMQELLQESGKVIADLLGAEAALITTGAAAGLVLGMAACMTGHDPEKMAQLPNTAGMKDEFIVQKRQRFQYDHCPTIAGARRVEVGDSAGTTPHQLAAAVGANTAAILHAAHLEGQVGLVPLAEVLGIGRARAVPVMVDAAPQVYPIETMKSYLAMGADLVLYSGKYFGAPNSTGILCGREDLVASAAAQDFMGYEHGGYRALGRPMKLDRHAIIGMVVALREWLEMDHGARLSGYRQQVNAISSALKDLEGVTISARPQMPAEGILVRVAIDPAKTGKNAKEVASILLTGHPRVWLHEHSDDEALGVWVGILTDADIEHLVRRLREVLTQ
jgi:uncharacterized pyridoxal phosphate-dependent enzyme